MRYKWGVLIGVLIFNVVVLLEIGFYYTGEWGWQDFRDRGATEKLWTKELWVQT